MAGNFFDKSRGRAVPLDEFPNLFAMQGHTGACGILFAALWFGFSVKSFPSIWISPAGGVTWLIYPAIFVCAAFFLLSYGSFSYSSHLIESLKESQKGTPNLEANTLLEHRVRGVMTVLTISYVFVCCVLIWLTGGATSPFVPFYVMIFTLTIAKNKIASPGIGVYILAYFLGAIFISTMTAEFGPTIIDKHTMADIKESGFQIAMHILFISASLVVPTLSGYFVEERERKMDEERERKMATQ